MDFFQLLRDWLQTVTLVEGDTVLKAVGVLGTFVTAVQVTKRLVETASRAEGVLAWIPGAQPVLNFLSTGKGPRLLNGALALATTAAAAAVDGRLTGGESYDLVTIVLGAAGITLGNEAIYRLMREKLFPKGHPDDLPSPALPKVSTTNLNGNPYTEAEFAMLNAATKPINPVRLR